MLYQYTSSIVNEYEEEQSRVALYIIMEFGMGIDLFREFVRSELLVSRSSIKTSDCIKQTKQRYADFYYGHHHSYASIEFIDQYNILLHFYWRQLSVSVKKEELDKTGVKSIEELFQEDIPKQVILSNAEYGVMNNGFSEIYYVPILKIVESK